MEKPMMKKQLVLAEYEERTRTISFYTNWALANKLRDLGDVDATFQKDRYRITVDYRYDFHEVVNYIESLEDPENTTG